MGSPPAVDVLQPQIDTPCRGTDDLSAILRNILPEAFSRYRFLEDGCPAFICQQDRGVMT
jgi:hypothetical protein